MGGRTTARSQGPSRRIALHSHLPATPPVPWPPGESGPVVRPPAQMNLLLPTATSPQGSEPWTAIILIRLGHHGPKGKRLIFCVQGKNSPRVFSESTHLGKHTSKALILLGDPFCEGRGSPRLLSQLALDFKKPEGKVDVANSRGALEQVG